MDNVNMKWLNGTLAGKIVKQLDSMDSKQNDGKIDASIWNKFMSENGGQTIDEGSTISMNEAMVKITKLALNDAAKAKKAGNANATANTTAKGYLNDLKNQQTQEVTQAEDVDQTQEVTQAEDVDQTQEVTQTEDVDPTQEVTQTEDVDQPVQTDEVNKDGIPLKDSNHPAARTDIGPKHFPLKSFPVKLINPNEVDIKPKDCPEIYKKSNPELAKKTIPGPLGQTIIFDSNGAISEIKDSHNRTIVENHEDSWTEYTYKENNQVIEVSRNKKTGELSSWVISERPTKITIEGKTIDVIERVHYKSNQDSWNEDASNLKSTKAFGSVEYLDPETRDTLIGRYGQAGIYYRRSEVQGTGDEDVAYDKNGKFLYSTEYVEGEYGHSNLVIRRDVDGNVEFYEKRSDWNVETMMFSTEMKYDKDGNLIEYKKYNGDDYTWQYYEADGTPIETSEWRW